MKTSSFRKVLSLLNNIRISKNYNFLRGNNQYKLLMLDPMKNYILKLIKKVNYI